MTDSSVGNDSSSDTQTPGHPAGTKGGRGSFAFVMVDTVEAGSEDTRGVEGAVVAS